jgi:hypothetical protein
LTDDRLSSHILPTSSTMVGVCMTAVSLLQVVEISRPVSRVDEMMAFDGLVFLISAILSYMAIRNRGPKASSLEGIADITFMFGLCLSVVTSFLMAYSIM